MNTATASTASAASTPSPAAVRATPRTPRALWVVRGAGLFQIVTGLLFWTGNALVLIPFHMLSGLILVIALWVIAVSAARRGVSLLPVAGAIAWGLFVVAFGLTQTAILRGDLHWIVQVAHLIVGMLAMGMAQSLARATRPT